MRTGLQCVAHMIVISLADWYRRVAAKMAEEEGFAWQLFVMALLQIHESGAPGSSARLVARLVRGGWRRRPSSRLTAPTWRS